MSAFLKNAALLLALTSGAFAQTKLSFDVATIKPALPLDQAKIVAAVQSGSRLPIGAYVDAQRAEYLYLDLRSLITYAYGVKPYQVSGPDWLQTTRFDINAKLPEGASKNDASKMLQTLLEERFHLATHRAPAERPVLALVAAKGGTKLKPSTGKPVAIDENAPLKAGETQMDGPEGPVRMKIDLTTGSSVIDAGLQGKMSYAVNPATRTMHIDFSMTTMSGFADMLTQLFEQIGGTGGRQILNMTGIEGNYDATVELPVLEIIALARASGLDLPNTPAPDPGSTSLLDALASLGLKLESRKASVDLLVVDRVDRAPSEN